jgi:hypothetical protein
MSAEDKDEGLGSDVTSAPDLVPAEPVAGGLVADPPAPLGLVHPRFDPREVFLRHHAALREGLATHPFPGVLAGIVDGDRLETLWVAASDDQVRAAIIGRHSRATLALPRDQASAALRHLALLVRAEGGQPQIRLLDLQTELGFADPFGRRFEAVRTGGPVFLSAGGAALVLFPTGEGRTLDPDPEAAWAAVPPRRWLARASRAPAGGPAGETVVRAEDGPRGCRARLCRPGEIPVGLASVAASGDETHIRVSGRAVDEGFLIGRYDRCEVGGPEADESLSRVHLLVIREGGRVLAIDTASTNGTYLGDDRVHLVELEDRSTLDLGGVLDFTWRIAN